MSTSGSWQMLEVAEPRMAPLAFPHGHPIPPVEACTRQGGLNLTCDKPSVGAALRAERRQAEEKKGVAYQCLGGHQRRDGQGEQGEEGQYSPGQSGQEAGRVHRASDPLGSHATISR